MVIYVNAGKKWISDEDENITTIRTTMTSAGTIGETQHIADTTES